MWRRRLAGGFEGVSPESDNLRKAEALVPPADAVDPPLPEDLYARVQAARARWVQGPDLPRHTLAPLADRVNLALLALVTRWPDAFAGTDLDPAATRERMQKLVAKVERLLDAMISEEGGSGVRRGAEIHLAHGRGVEGRVGIGGGDRGGSRGG